MNAIREYLSSEKYQPELYDDDGWKLLEAARAELVQHDAAIAAAVKAEREACAKVADDAEHDGTVMEVRMKWKIAAAIRARSNGEGSK